MPEIDQELAALGAPVTSTFTPHLLPLDQGELVSCYVTTTRAVGQDRVDAAYGGWSRTSRSSTSSHAPPGVRDVRDTNICAIHVHADERTGKVFVFAAIDNLWKGAASQAVQNLNLMFGIAETLGIEPVSPSSPRAGCRGPSTSSERPARACRRASAPARRRRRASRRRAGSTSGCWSATRPRRRSAARFTRRACSPRPCS